MLFENLDGLGLRDSNARAAVGQSVRSPPAAVTAAAERVHDVMPGFFGIIAAEPEIAAGPRRRWEAMRPSLFAPM
jgi:hypothetical protein